MSNSPQSREGTPQQQSRELVDAQETPDVHYMHAPIMREQAEPRDGHEPVPLWLTVFYSAVIFWGGYYLASYSGGFSPEVYDENRVNASATSGKDAKPDPAKQGKRLFISNCAACHQQTGKGVAGQFPPLAGSKWVTGEPAVLTRILLHGLQGPIVVDGETYNGNMPAFGEKLNDEDLALLLTYIRQDWGNKASDISPDYIKLVRENEKDRSKPWDVSALEAIEPEPAVSGDSQADSSDEDGQSEESGSDKSGKETAGSSGEEKQPAAGE